MSWPTGRCEKCGAIRNYRWCWGYEDPDGIEDVDGILLCQECETKGKE